MKLNKKTVISLIPKAVLLILLLVIINTQLTESVVTGTFEKGLVFAILALGIFISFRILDIPDLSVDGTFTLGVAVSVMQAFNGDPIKGILLSIVAGAIAGSVTGILITKLNVQPILAGIITMTALYSINLKIMDRPNISLYKKDTIFTIAQKYFGDYYKLAAAGIVLVIAAVLLFWFLKTQAGMSLRATGDNEYMVRASSINSDRMKIMGFAIANALVSLSRSVFLSRRLKQRYRYAGGRPCFYHYRRDIFQQALDPLRNTCGDIRCDSIQICSCFCNESRYGQQLHKAFLSLHSCPCYLSACYQEVYHKGIQACMQ